MEKFLTLLLLIFFFACQSESQNHTKKNFNNIELITPTGNLIQTTIAYTPSQQEQGLSGVRPENFDDDQGMLFFYLEDGERLFWMPDTYFNLDIFYLDKNLKIIDIVRKLPFYIGRSNPQLIPRARAVWARHVLEMKSNSEIAENLKIGDTLNWRGNTNLHETENLIKNALRTN